MNNKGLDKNLNYGSVLPLVIFIAGLLVIYFMSLKMFGEAFMTMIISAIIYVVAVIVRNTDRNPPTEFNLILENISTFMTFGISSIAFGVLFYTEELSLVLILFIYFFAITTVLSMARNWEVEARDALGWPIAFNGIFLPLFYYIYLYYFQTPGNSIFLFYFAIVGALSVSSHRFLFFDEKYLSKTQEEIDDELFQKRQEEKEKKKQRIVKEEKEAEHALRKEFDENYKEEYQKEKDRKKAKEIENLFPSEKEVIETFTEEKEDKKENHKPKNTLKNILIDKIATKLKTIKSIIKKEDNFNKIEDMPNKKELKETLVSEKKELKKNNQSEIKEESEIVETKNNQVQQPQSNTNPLIKKLVKYSDKQKEKEKKPKKISLIKLIRNKFQKDKKTPKTKQPQIPITPESNEEIPTKQEVTEVFTNEQEVVVEEPKEEEKEVIEVKQSEVEEKKEEFVKEEPAIDIGGEEYDLGEFEDDYSK